MPTTAQKNRFLKQVSKSLSDCMGRCSKTANQRRANMDAILTARSASRSTYRKSDKGKASRKKYRQGDKYKARRNAYASSEKGKAARARYRASKKAKMEAAATLAGMAA